MSTCWQESFSKTYNRTYWFNTITGESVWEDPATKTTAASERGSDLLLDGSQLKRRKVENDVGAHETSSVISSTDADVIVEESPRIGIERELIRDQLLTLFSQDNEKMGEMKGAYRVILVVDVSWPFMAFHCF